VTYTLFGGGGGDFTVSRDVISGDTALDLKSSAPLTAWTAPTGGTQITDLRLYDPLASGTPGAAAPAGVFSSAADGSVRIWAQDTVDAVWIVSLSGTGTRYLLQPANLQSRLRSVETTNVGQLTNVEQVPSARPSDMIYYGQNMGVAMTGFGGTLTPHDTTDFAKGTESSKVVTPGAGAVECGYGITSGPTLPDLTGKEPIIWFKITGMANTIDFKFKLGDAGFAHFYEWNLSEAGTEYPFMRDGEWYAITLPLGGAVIQGGSAPALNALNSFKISIYDNGSSPITLQFGGFGYITRQTKYPNGVVTIRFDDLFASNLTKAAPILDKYGYRASSYAIAETLYNHATFGPTYATLDQARKLEEQHGWEICSHAYTAAVHNQVANQGGTGNKGYQAYATSAQLDDMRRCRDYLRSQGFRGAQHFAWPQGAWDETARLSAKQVFSSVMTLAHANDETVPVADPTRIRCYAPPSSVTGAQLTAEVDKAKAGKEWLTVLFHDIADIVTNSVQISTAAFQTFVDYLNSQGVAVRLASEVLDVPNP
jgi:peptidoglycan/xylan/chitin deacetylase (PgdA/CDA1 family)